MPTVGSQDEAVLVLSSHPLWEDYKAALLKVDEARARFRAVPDQDAALREEAACYLREASQACDALRKQIMDLRRRTWL